MGTEGDGARTAERRRDARHDVGVPAELTLVGLTVQGRLANVSARGVCFVTSDPHLRVEALNFVQIAFALPVADGAPAQAVRRHVRVRHVEQVDEAGAKARRLGLEWDEPLVLDALGG